MGIKWVWNRIISDKGLAKSRTVKGWKISISHTTNLFTKEFSVLRQISITFDLSLSYDETWKSSRGKVSSTHFKLYIDCWVCVKATLNYRFFSHSIVVIAHKFSWFSTPDKLMLAFVLVECTGVEQSWDTKKSQKFTTCLLRHLARNENANEEVSQFLAWNSLEISELKCHWTFTASLSLNKL